MRTILALVLISQLGLAVEQAPMPKAADEVKHTVPYRLTETKHVMVRVKMNGKGPYNFILDTGAPAVFIPKKVAKAIDLDVDKEGWGTFKSFELEGGLMVDKAKCRVEDLFQLEGMNGMGLAGFELHGVIGYNVLAKYRITYDFTVDKLTFVTLDFIPPAIQPIGKGGGGQGSLDMMGSLAKVMGGLLGIKPNFELHPSGSIGLELVESKEGLTVKTVYAGSPAADAGIQKDDKITAIRNTSVTKLDDLKKALTKAKPGELLKVTLTRGRDKKNVTVTLGKGL